MASLKPRPQPSGMVRSRNSKKAFSWPHIFPYLLLAMVTGCIYIETCFPGLLNRLKSSFYESATKILYERWHELLFGVLNAIIAVLMYKTTKRVNQATLRRDLQEQEHRMTGEVLIEETSKLPILIISNGTMSNVTLERVSITQIKVHYHSRGLHIYNHPHSWEFEESSENVVKPGQYSEFEIISVLRTLLHAHYELEKRKPHDQVEFQLKLHWTVPDLEWAATTTANVHLKPEYLAAWPTEYCSLWKPTP